VIRTTISAISSMLFAGVLHAECVLMPPQESSSHVRIQVVLAGNPVKGAKVIIRASQECTCATDMLRGNPLDTTTPPRGALQITDENGIANLPEFAPGDYDVAVTLNGVASTGFIGLHVSNKVGSTTLPVDLTEQVRRVENVPLRDRVEAFRGTVRDISGAPLAGASIVVVKRESHGKDVVLTGKTDADGHFSGQLDEGSYIAVFFSPAFRPAIAPFEVAKSGARELSVSLDVSHCPYNF
jgi:ribosomal protein L19